MFNLDDPVVRLKTGLLDRILPTNHVIVFGDMYVVEGGYTEYCATHGATNATLVDTLETVGWLQTRLAHRNIDFYKGDFSNPGFMASIGSHYSVAVAYEVLLHQPALVKTLNLMLASVSDKIVIVQPTLEEQPVPNSLVFLPGNPDSSLYPAGEQHPEYAAFSLEDVNQSNWIWGITASFMRAALAAEGFEVTYEELGDPLPNDRWSQWGCIAERTRSLDHRHWSKMRANPELHEGWK